MKLCQRIQRLKDDIPAVFLALKNRETPLIARIFAAITVAYVLSPIDLIPDFIPILGYLDDVLILPLLVWLTIRWIPVAQLDACRLEAQGLRVGECPRKWYFALPVLLIWSLVILSVLRAIF